MVKRKERVWALLLSAALTVVQLPATAMAENREPKDGSIASFEDFDNEVKMQTVATGTELSELKLPDTVKAKIYHVFQDTVIPEEEDTETDEDSSAATPGEAEKKGTRGKSADFREDDRVKTVTKVTVSAEKIPVTWDSDPVYDSHMEGSYRFTADVGSYILSDGVKLPVITVTVKQEIPEQPIEQPAEKPIQKPTDNKAPCTLTEGCTLLDGHEGGCIPPADNSSSGSSSSGDSGGSYSNTSILQGTWVQTDTGIWKFRRTNGSYAKNQWGISDGLWYYFGSDGQLLTGWQFLNSQWYYLCTDETAKVRDGMKEGAMASGWYYDLFYQNWFYLDENGAMVTGWREIDGTQYYFNPVSDGQKGILTETSEKQP